VTDPQNNRYGVDTLHITTPALPETFPSVDILTASPADMEAGWNLSGLSVGGAGEAGRFTSYPFIFDTNGDIRWYLDLSHFTHIVDFIQRLENGNFLAGHARSLYELDVLGREVNRWDIPDYWYHHDVIEKPDGNFLIAVNKEGLATVEDHVIEIGRSTGTIVREWDLRQILDVDRHDLLANESDWFHMNAIWYEEQDDALILSGRNQGVVKVDGNNNLVWILAPHQGWGAAGLDGNRPNTADYLLTAVDANGTPYGEAVQQGTADAPNFAWVWGQHAPMRLDNGNLFIFDNGYNRNFSDAGHWSRGVEYEIDEDAMTIRQIWEYGRSRGEAYYSQIISDVDELSETSNRLIMPGIINNEYAHVTEVTYPGKGVVFDARINFANLYGSGQGWGEIDIVYRSERLPLYLSQVGSAATSQPRVAQRSAPATSYSGPPRSL